MTDDLVTRARQLADEAESITVLRHVVRDLADEVEKLREQAITQRGILDTDLTALQYQRQRADAAEQMAARLADALCLNLPPHRGGYVDKSRQSAGFDALAAYDEWVEK